MLWIELANSQARDPLGQGAVTDYLEDAAWVRQYAQKWQLRPRHLRSGRDRDRLRRLRSLLQRWVRTVVANEPVSERDLQALNRFLKDSRVRPKLTRHDNAFQLDMITEATGIDAWLFAIAISFAEFLVDADPARLKTCDNPDCQWVFYDQTRSRTRRWCDVSCGDLIKVREFRQRQKANRA